MVDSIPVISRVDVAVLGGSSGAVAAALAAAQRGASVYLLAPRPYLGDDIAARFDYWPAADDELATDLARRVFPHQADPDAAPPTPLHVKRTLEQGVVGADIPLLLNTRPAGVLRDGAGRIAGVVIANRAGRQAIVARQVIDATERAAVARQAGLEFTDPPAGTLGVRHITLGGEAPVAGLECEDLPAMLAPTRKGDQPLAARRYTLSVDAGDGSCAALADAYADVARRCWRPGVFQQSETLDVDWPDRLAGETIADRWAGCGELPLDALAAEPGLSVLNHAARVGRDVAGQLTRPAHLMAVGERLGEAIAADATGTDDPREPLTVACARSRTIDDGAVRTLLAGLRPGDELTATIDAPANRLPVIDTYDVIVIGGGTGGASAAIASGRAGARTLLCESLAVLGGVGTAGQICKYYYGNITGFTDQINRGVGELETDAKIAGNQQAWTPAAKQAWYLGQCREADVAVWFATLCCGALVENDRVKGVVVAGPHGYGLVRAHAIIDATGNADVAAAAGAPTTGIGAEHVAVQGTGLTYIAPDHFYHNTDHSFSDDADVVDATSFLVASKQKFGDQYDFGQLIDSRERRQIIGDITLGPADFLAERRFADSICLSSSNFDTHGFTVHPLFQVKPPDKQRMWVYVPYRCLLPAGFEGLLATGLGVSAHRDAIPVIRMQPDVQNQGYAAGRAAAMAAQARVELRDIDIKQLQRHLIDIGNLPDNVLSDEDTFPVDDATLEWAAREGWDDYRGLALLFTEADRARPLLRAAHDATDDHAKRVRYAHVLALMGDAHGEASLRQTLSDREWDAGWNYRGMGQFGMSMSEVDALLIALGGVGDAGAWPIVLDKIAALDAEPDFSHCRAVAEACEKLYARWPDPRAAVALAGVLNQPGLAGHEQRTFAQAQAALTDDQNENAVRNGALRELHLARGIARCGDTPDRLGRGTLEQYTDDLRGHFARHARAVLRELPAVGAATPAPAAAQ